MPRPTAAIPTYPTGHPYERIDVGAGITPRTELELQGFGCRSQTLMRTAVFRCLAGLQNDRGAPFGQDRRRRYGRRPLRRR